MKQSIVHIALVVDDYDEAIDFYTNKLHFTLIEDTYQPEQDKRWVVVAPPAPAVRPCCWHAHPNPSSGLSSATRPAGGCSSSSTPMTSGGTTTRW